MASTADAVIIGGGVMGCSILYNLAERGVTNTVLLERDVLASGSTSRSQAILRMHYSNEVTTRLSWDSLSIFRTFTRSPAYPPAIPRRGTSSSWGPEDRRAMEKNVAMQGSVGVDTSVVTAEDVREIAPMVETGDGEAFAYEPESGYGNPYSVTTGYANAARERGARVLSSSPVTGVEINGDRVSAVLTEDGRIETPIAVVATGPWSGPFLSSIGVDVPLRPIRHQVVMLRRPQDIVPDHPIIGDVVHDMSPRPDVGNITLIGVGEDEDAEPETFNQGVDMPMVERTFENLTKRMPGMASALFRGGWSGLFTTTPDWHPVLDRVEGIEGLYLAVVSAGTVSSWRRWSAW